MTLLFSDLPIISEIQSALHSLGYSIPTPIQEQAIPPLLAGKDLLGCAQTGTGKTAAFAIPMLQHLHVSKSRPTPFEPQGLVLAPTRELVVQIAENFAAIGKKTRVKHACIYGGVGQRPQVAALTAGVQILIATPGRLLDLIEQNYCNLSNLKHFVLDEADRMLDMGFMPEIQRIIRMLPRQKQSAFLSATMPPPIKSLAGALLQNHVSVMIAPPATTADRVRQRVMFINKGNKRKLLDLLLEKHRGERILVFMKTKHGADRMYKSLAATGLKADGIHGGRSQNARQRVLNAFKDGSINILVATDVAARGIDIDDISHVINFEVPQDPDNYVHRIGRTARAGAAGESITFCDGEEYSTFKEIEETIGKKIEVDREHPFHSSEAEDEELQSANKYLVLREKKRADSKLRRASSTEKDSGKSRTARGEPRGAQAGKSGSARSEEAGKSPEEEVQVTRRRSISGKVRKVRNRPAKKKYASPWSKSASGKSSGKAGGRSSSPKSGSAKGFKASKKKSTGKPGKKGK